MSKANDRTITDRLRDLLDMLGRLLQPNQPQPAYQPIPVRKDRSKRES